jgi:N-methylhydantoinase A
MVDIGAAHVSRCIRLVSVQRGHDPKAYTLYGYGGMGPMISALAAEELKIRRVIVPPHPGLFSALGLLVADLRRIFRETEILPLAPDAGARIEETFARLRARPSANSRATAMVPTRSPSSPIWRCAIAARVSSCWSRSIRRGSRPRGRAI